MKHSIKYHFLLAAILLPFNLAAQVGNAERLTGSVSRSGFSVGKCHIRSMTVKYEFSTYMKEPTASVNIKWKKGRSTNKDCLGGEPFELFIKINTEHYAGDLLIAAGEGALPEGNGTYSHTPFEGPPDWDHLLIPFNHGDVKAFQSNRKYLPAEQAKKIWKSGFRVISVVFIDSEGNEVTLAKY